MKFLSTLTLVSAIMMTGLTCAAQAEELKFNAPDINGKLGVLVEKKMNTLSRQTQAVHEQARVSDQSRNSSNSEPAVTQEVPDYEIVAIHSEIL